MLIFEIKTSIYGLTDIIVDILLKIYHAFPEVLEDHKRFYRQNIEKLESVLCINHDGSIKGKNVVFILFSAVILYLSGPSMTPKIH